MSLPDFLPHSPLSRLNTKRLLQHSRIAPSAHSVHRRYDQSDHFGLHNPPQLPRERAQHPGRYVWRLGPNQPTLSAPTDAASTSVSSRRLAL
jgi:hypothetical protein